jgi:hypothetical protein
MWRGTWKPGQTIPGKINFNGSPDMRDPVNRKAFLSPVSATPSLEAVANLLGTVVALRDAARKYLEQSLPIDDPTSRKRLVEAIEESEKIVTPFAKETTCEA